MKIGDVLWAVVFFAWAFVMGLVAGSMATESKYRTEAVRRMAARWEVDSSGKAEFKWTLEPILEK